MLSQVLADTSAVDAVLSCHLFDVHSSLVVSDELCGLLTLDLIEYWLVWAPLVVRVSAIARWGNWCG